MKHKQSLLIMLPVFFSLVFFVLPLQPAGSPPSVKVETGYYTIPLMTKFSVKVNTVGFAFPNSGTKKVDPNTQQVLGVQFAVWNNSDKEIRVRRMDFSVNGQQINHFVVKEKTTTPLVVKIPPKKAIGVINYYIMDKNVKSLKDLKVVYSSVDKTYKKKSLIIPVIAAKKK